MNQTKNLLLMITLAALAGCAASHSTVVIDVVGPDLTSPRKTISSGHGQLVVYSALEVLELVSQVSEGDE